MPAQVEDYENIRGKITLQNIIDNDMEIGHLVNFYNKNENFKSILFSETKPKEGPKSPAIGAPNQLEFADQILEHKLLNRN